MSEWNKPGLPHKGWTCVDVIDLAEGIDETESIPYKQCEMCGNEKIRYAHVMSHPDYPDEIYVGCVCAEKMTGDYVNPRRCENELRNRAQRRKNFKKVKYRRIKEI